MEKQDYSQMSNDELHAENLNLGEQKQAIRAKQLEINAELSRRAVADELKSEQKRLQDKFGPKVQIVGVAGIASKAGVGATS